jgi:hypothetical protein
MFGGVGRSARGLGAAFLIVLGATLLRAAAPAPVLASQTGLSYVSVATWTVDPAAARVHVSLEITARSNTVDSPGRRYFFTKLQLTLPPSTADYAATDSKGEPLPVAIEARVPSGVVVGIGFPQKLYSGQSVTFGLAFDVVDSGGEPDRDLRVSQDVVSFPISAFGSVDTPGSSVSVVFPAGFSVQELGNLTSQTDSAGRTVFRSGTIADSTALTAWFTASASEASTRFLTSQIVVGPLSVTLRYWASDPSWAVRVSGILSAGYPILRKSIGLGDPATRSITVEEATIPGIGGFRGEYDPASARIKVAYSAPYVVLHEITHLWFNSDLSSDRWINEGFAQYYAQQAILALGLPDRSVALSPSLLSASAPLNFWTSAGVPGNTEVYLYGASLEAAREIAALAGDDGLRSVWAMQEAHRSAYGRSGPTEGDIRSVGPLDWRRLLDYLEQSTGRSFTRIWQHWVVTPFQASMLDERDAARAAYKSAQTAAGWDLPPDVRQAMGSWTFGLAQGLLSEVSSILEYRDRIVAAAPVEEVTPPQELAVAFQTQSTAAALQEGRSEAEALSALALARQAQASNHGAAGAVGLLGEDPRADLVAARAAFSRGDPVGAKRLADSARAAWVGATGIGQVRIMGAAAGTAGVLLLVALYLWTRPRRRAVSELAASARTGPPGQQPNA